VRIVPHAVSKPSTVAAVARSVFARSVYASTAIALYERAALDVDLRLFSPILSAAPQSFPPPPPIASAIPAQSSAVAASPGSADGEQQALIRLRALARAGTSPSVALRLLAPELNAGTLAQCRVTCECGTSLPPPPSSSNPRAAMGIGAVQAASATTVLGAVGAYDVLGSDRREIEWDESSQQFKLKAWDHEERAMTMSINERWDEFVRRRKEFLFDAFFPPDVTPDYYAFTAWRFSQRCMSATVGVFGTQALLLALGVKAGRIGQAAAISWVLKDGLGRVGKMIWASGMGKDFDVDPKRWRFRSALLYATGNGLEIVTQVFPASFLLFATAANTLKQVSMLTSSACRNAMYRSFSEKTQNIANITAKGEAQIVIADLIGMVAGIKLSKTVGTSKGSVLTAYTILTTLDIFGIYMELRQVVFRTLNPERSTLIIEDYMKDGKVLTPAKVSRKERIFRRPRYRSRTRFSSIAKAAKSPEELAMLLEVFRRDTYLVSMPTTKKGGTGPCRVVLRKDASNEDVLRAMLTAANAIEAVKKLGRKNGNGSGRGSENGKKQIGNIGDITIEEQLAILKNAKKAANKTYPSLNRQLKLAGWDTGNLLFSTLKRRGYWRKE